MERAVTLIQNRCIHLVLKKTGFTSKCERAERTGGGGEVEAIEEPTAGAGRRAFACLRRWSNRALHTLCSSSILGPSATLENKKEKKEQDHNAIHTYCMMHCEL